VVELDHTRLVPLPQIDQPTLGPLHDLLQLRHELRARAQVHDQLSELGRRLLGALQLGPQAGGLGGARMIERGRLVEKRLQRLEQRLVSRRHLREGAAGEQLRALTEQPRLLHPLQPRGALVRVGRRRRTALERRRVRRERHAVERRGGNVHIFHPFAKLRAKFRIAALVRVEFTCARGQLLLP